MPNFPGFYSQFTQLFHQVIPVNAWLPQCKVKNKNAPSNVVAQ